MRQSELFGQEKGRILIAEDNDLNRENLAELLTENGYEVKTVCDGREGIEAFLEDKFDMVITDLRMPHVDGLQFLQYVKNANKDNIVIMITGHGTIDAAVESM
ncbi:MAG TPA: response regulator, partial [Smithellaceae bacterium]|nr:response regulator [Smithellaceae bacterium]